MVPGVVPDPRNPSGFHPRTVWLTTPRTAPAWTALLNLLDDDQWHNVGDIAQAMRDSADLAPTTIKKHLRSAARRGWIQTRGNRARLRNRDLIETALDALDGQR